MNAAKSHTSLASHPNKSSVTISSRICWHFSLGTSTTRIQFIGGTALARTHLPDGRLSEDIDLIAVDDRKAVAADLDAALPVHWPERTAGSPWIRPFSGVANTGAAVLRSGHRHGGQDPAALGPRQSAVAHWAPPPRAALS